MRNLFMKYCQIKEQIKNINVSNKEFFKIAMTSLFISFIIFIGPIVLVCNMFIYYDYIKYYVLGIFNILVIMFYLTRMIYIEAITNNLNIKLKEYIIFKGIVNLALIIIVSLVVIII